MQRFIITVVVFLFYPVCAFAGLGQLASLYGVLPEDMALAGARAAGFPDPAAAFYNPAALAEIGHTSMSVGYLYAQPYFRGGRAGQVESFEEFNGVTSFCVVMDIGRVFTPDYPMTAAIDVLIDDNLGTMVFFEERYYENGRFARYGIHNFNMVHSWGVRVIEGINLGAGFIMGYITEVKLDQNVQMTGEIKNQQITLIGKPALSPIFGIQWITERFRTGLVYQGRMLHEVDPVTGTTVVKVGDVDFMSVPNYSTFRDGFEPSKVALGAALTMWNKLTTSIQVEWLNWEELNDEIPVHDVTGHRYNIRAKDVFLPRVGVEASPWTNWEIRAGYAFEPSPFTKLGSGNNLILDNDRHRATLGLGYEVHPSFLRAPVSFDAVLMYFQLAPREHRTQDQQVLWSEGYLVGGGASVTIRY